MPQRRRSKQVLVRFSGFRLKNHHCPDISDSGDTFQILEALSDQPPCPVFGHSKAISEHVRRAVRARLSTNLVLESKCRPSGHRESQWQRECSRLRRSLEISSAAPDL